MVMRGAGAYALVCENCHGGPGLGQSPAALSMRPEPPMVLEATTHFTDKQLFFIVANGVRYSAMPAYPVQNRPYDEVWALVAFLKKARTVVCAMDRATYLHAGARRCGRANSSADADSGRDRCRGGDHPLHS